MNFREKNIEKKTNGQSNLTIAASNPLILAMGDRNPVIRKKGDTAPRSVLTMTRRMSSCNVVVRSVTVQFLAVATLLSIIIIVAEQLSE